MDFLNKALAQFNDLFRSMTPGGRITAGLLLVVVVVSVGYLFQSQVTGGDDLLFSGDSISTPTLQKMEGAFGKAGLNGFTINKEGQVKVPHAQRASYLAALADAKALPPNFTDMLGEANEGNIFESPKQREQRINHAREDTLSMIIGSMKGIERAVVMISQREKSAFELESLKTASVTAWGQAGMLLDEDLVDKICSCVVGANAGMKPENVTISDANGMSYIGSALEHGGHDDPYAHAVRMAEHTLNAKIREALSYIPNLTVSSMVMLDHEKNSRSVEIKNDPKPVPVRTLENNRTSNRESSPAGGAPGFQAQGGGANQPASLVTNGGKGSNETSDESKTEQVNVVSSTSTEKETFGLTPKSAKVSVGIPTSYFEKVWKERNPVKEGEEPKKPDPTAIDPISEEITKKVIAAVANLLPTGPEVRDPTSLVTVTTFQDIKAIDIPAPAVTQRAMSWLGQNWTMAAMLGLVLFSLSMLRSMLRGTAAPSPQSAGSAAVAMRVTAADGKTEASEEPVEVAAARRLRRITGTGPSLRDELSEFVKEDPDSAANILRSWIGQVT